MTYRELIAVNEKKALLLQKEKSAVLMLIRELANFSISDLYLNYDFEVSNSQFIQTKVDEYLEHDIAPQYVLGYTYFYGNRIAVDNDVLIPRADTEILVGEILNLISAEAALKIVDVGTGSGCIAIAIKKQRPNSTVLGLDISKKAIDIAKKNATINDVDILFKQNDLLTGINDKFDILISNPPYIDKFDDVDEIVVKNEPSLSLFAEEKGLYFFRKILEESVAVMKNKFIIAFEIGYHQAAEVVALADKVYPRAKKRVVKDYNSNDRVVIINN